MSRGYQYGFSKKSRHLFDAENRERKARTMVAVLDDFLPGPLGDYDVLNVGGSAGAIDNHLADHFKRVVSVDIDDDAVKHAHRTFSKCNLEYQIADALNLPFADESFHVVISSHVYEHVPDPDRMLEEIRRVLRSGGVCYFSAGNRLAWNEPHYGLPLLSVLPRWLAHLYIRISGRADHYHEKHLSYWGLRTLVRHFTRNDYTIRLIDEPTRFHTEYMLPPGSFKAALARIVARRLYWACPGYIWLLKK